MNRRRGMFVVAACAVLLAGCGGSSEPQSERDKYLEEVNSANSDRPVFLSDEAALGYLKNYCQSAESGTPATKDEVDEIVASYCGTDLATEVGVTPMAEPTTEGVDLEAFRAQALDEFGVGAEEEDGSSLDAVATAQMLCNGDVETMLSNLGDNFEGSFQQLALTTFCPGKLP